MPDVRVGAKTSEERMDVGASLDARASGAFSFSFSFSFSVGGALPRSSSGASSSRIGGSSSSPRCARRCMRRSVMPAARNARRFPGGGRVHPRSSKSNAISSRSLSDPGITVFRQRPQVSRPRQPRHSGSRAVRRTRGGSATGGYAARRACRSRARVSSTDDPTRGLERCVFSRDVFLRELQNIRANNGNRPGDVMKPSRARTAEAHTRARRYASRDGDRPVGRTSGRDVYPAGDVRRHGGGTSPERLPRRPRRLAFPDSRPSSLTASPCAGQEQGCQPPHAEPRPRGQGQARRMRGRAARRPRVHDERDRDGQLRVAVRLRPVLRGCVRRRRAGRGGD